jgi:hypothetical protein
MAGWRLFKSCLAGDLLMDTLEPEPDVPVPKTSN